jgi:hypothetical protein
MDESPVASLLTAGAETSVDSMSLRMISYRWSWAAQVRQRTLGGQSSEVR